MVSLTVITGALQYVQKATAEHMPFTQRTGNALIY